MADMTEGTARLDRMLSQLRRTEPELPGADFTVAVMSELPTARAMPAWKKNALLLGATTLASAIVAWQIQLPPLTLMTTALVENLPQILGASAALTWSAAAAGIWLAVRR